MVSYQYLFGVFAALATLGIVVEMLRRRRLRERHAIWWLIAGSLALLVSIFPTLLTSTARYLGFEVPANFAFFIAVLVLFIVALQTSSELTKVESHNRRLAEQIALLEIEIKEIQVKLNKNK